MDAGKRYRGGQIILKTSAEIEEHFEGSSVLASKEVAPARYIAISSTPLHRLVYIADTPAFCL